MWQEIETNFFILYKLFSTNFGITFSIPIRTISLALSGESAIA